MKINFENYGYLSTLVYEKTKSVRVSIQGDIEYYKDRLKEMETPILEAGVGTRRMLIPLLENNKIVHGIDESEAMLAVCKRHLKERKLKTTLMQKDLLSAIQENYYGAVIIPTGTFLLFSREDAIKLLKNMYISLHEEGKIVFDLLFPYDFVVGRKKETKLMLDKEHIIMTTMEKSISFITQTTHTYIEYTLWQKTTDLQKEYQKMSLSWYGIEEIKHILHSIGYKNISISSNYVFGDHPKNNEDILTVEAYR